LIQRTKLIGKLPNFLRELTSLLSVFMRRSPTIAKGVDAEEELKRVEKSWI